mmetsp:Transcript_9774/g.17590  ORF Transcript_9774/g.17590 Transcript_9774/m.17590 type:complete len:128 (-) Transcript_9774:204-587(-)|eukprot:CAMPEP_0168608202 /NCGR_PEP_ID=MMETSP0449_2-20121227/495_1 /TAXON_ID=1082188 /ORGANISM="Strombidium rassoulzadegani, Strain ras09" /LENGTH=127 /DNA_ID=CAMNT_0008648159 /DNA_START=77 /DNA_END=460 /DNA_ORIENTATION=+
MSKNFSANQYEYNYSPKSLGNWEIPKDSETGVKTSATRRWNTLRSKTKATQFVVDERGHLLPGVPKTLNSFLFDMPHQTRWPTANPCVKVGSKATMGYKGITTEYLPRTTVPIKTVEIPGCRETGFR